ncbi:hypothetical protein P280DRAFT_473248 [Massarina eburnea CBS 473.64]|uniref:Uncharacterized protein n=1 Tax=Massarina eburnea CBS 473.64 TaxID=1395130 RepID=A0A6A6RL83_9PLEO|nr:hypothetical protein P280DRAFT_473248 [Massarina eburnea CBS 473.64]
MYDHNDMYENPSQPNPGTISSAESPHLDKRICGCRCGQTSGQEGREVNFDDAASTLVASDTSDIGDRGGTMQNTAGTAASAEELRARIRLFLRSMEGSRQRMAIDEQEQIGRVQNYQDAADSTESEPGSDAHSAITPDNRSVHCMSPGPGLGAWTTDDRPHVSFPYHFRVTPLRLTPTNPMF